VNHRVLLVTGLLGAIALLGSCSEHAIDEPELQRVSLPGFSIALPAGRVKSTAKEGFGGRHELQLPDPGLLRRLPFATNRRAEAIVSVGWNQHGLDEKEYSEYLRGMILKTVPGGKVLREADLGPGMWVQTIGNSKVSVTYATRSCERGFNVDLVVAVNSRAAADFVLTRTMVESIVCSLTEANRRRPEPAVRLPDGFGRAMHEKDPVFVTLGGESLYLSFTSGDIPGSDAFRTVVAALVSQVLGVSAEKIVIEEIAGASDDDRRHRLVSASAGGDLFYEGALWCPGLGITFMVTYSSTQPSDARARQVFDSIYCPGEAGTTAPDARPMLEQACAAENSFACEMLKTYSF
jgi:hypothetical protein